MTNYIPNSLQTTEDKLEKIYADAWQEFAWAETYEEMFSICEKGQQKVEELLNQK